MIDDLKIKYQQLDVSGKLVAAIILTTLFFWLLGLVFPIATSWFSLPSGFLPAFLQPWSWLTYGFMHGGLLHLAFNMLVLYFTGQLFLNLFGQRQFLTLFFSGVLAGGFAFTIASGLFNGFLLDNVLVGASAGVYALLFFICVYMPDTAVRLFFVLNVKLKYLGMGLIVLDLIAIVTNTNAGGSIAHLAGAALGYYAATQMKSGVDVLEGLAGIGDGAIGLFKKQNVSKSGSKRSTMKTVYRSEKRATSAPVKKSRDHQERIDSILDKISDSGYESLTRAEKDFLFKAGNE